MSAGPWRVERATGPAADFHGRPLPDPASRQVWLFKVSRPALVLGSAQPATHVDVAAAEAAGVEVVRRHSGGGGVLLLPDEVVWADVLVPRGDELWTEDIGRAPRWLGEVWADALGALGVLDARVHPGPMVRTEWSPRACFAGLGPGEVTVAGRKIVGVSQRRVRGQCRFQSALLLRWSPAEVAVLLAGTGGGRSPAETGRVPGGTHRVSGDASCVPGGTGSAGALGRVPDASGRVPDVSGRAGDLGRVPDAAGLENVAVGLADLVRRAGVAPQHSVPPTVDEVEDAFLSAIADR